MSSCLPKDVLKLAVDLEDDIYKPGAKEHIMALIRAMSIETSLQRLEDCEVPRFYTDVLNNQAAFVHDLQTLSSKHRSTEREVELVSKRCLMRNYIGNMSEVYAHYSTLEVNRLLFMLEVMRTLRHSIGVAAAASHLPPDLLAKLKRRLEQFDNRSLYSRACVLVAYASPKEPCLVSDSKTWWSVRFTHLAGIR